MAAGLCVCVRSVQPWFPGAVRTDFGKVIFPALDWCTLPRTALTTSSTWLYKTAQFLLKCYKILSNLWPPRHDKSHFHLKRIRRVPEEYKTECTEKWGWALPKLFLVFSLLADWLAILVEVGEEKHPQSRGISQAGLTQHAKQVSQSADRCSCTPKTGWQVFAVGRFECLQFGSMKPSVAKNVFLDKLHYFSIWSSSKWAYQDIAHH